MTVKVVEFTTLEKTGQPVWDSLAPRMGVVYVVAITRDGCPACKRQKPKLDKMAAVLSEKHGKRVTFTRIHVNYSSESQEESFRSKDVLRHYFYPTNLILIKSKDKGAIEYYRNASPSMTELKRNIEKAVEVAKFFAKPN